MPPHTPACSRDYCDVEPELLCWRSATGLDEQTNTIEKCGHSGKSKFVGRGIVVFCGGVLSCCSDLSMCFCVVEMVLLCMKQMFRSVQRGSDL